MQAQQFRQTHEDCHYASALYCYEKTLKYRQHLDFVRMDDKHSCKVGEPGCPVAAVERAKQVIVGLNETIEVADHNFTRTSITPSVIFHLDLPEDMEGSFYRGKVFVGLKEKCFEPSLPLGHVSELVKLLECQEINKEILCLYTNGGPDH